MIIEESGMCFGEYDVNNVFHIENSEQYKKYLMPNGVKSCEFILLRGKTLYFIEAKTSCPNQISKETPQEKIGKYNEYISDIVNKIRHSIALYMSILVRIHAFDDVSEDLLKWDLHNRSIKVILVVKNAKQEWLDPLKTKLDRELSKDKRIWKFNFFVINEQMARQKNLIK